MAQLLQVGEADGGDAGQEYDQQHRDQSDAGLKSGAANQAGAAGG